MPAGRSTRNNEFTADGQRRTDLVTGEPVHPKGRYLLQPGDRFNIREAGGGGFGPPSARAIASVLDDVAEGCVTADAAKSEYGVDVATGTRAAI